MTYLILTCHTGGGHNAAAKAIKEEAAKRGITCVIQDALAFIPKPKEDFVTKGHSLAYKLIPQIYGAGYKYAENHVSGQGMLKDYSKYADKIAPYLKEHFFDAVICVHVFAAMVMTGVRRDLGIQIPTAFVATDYTCSPGVNTLDVDRWFIPRDMTTEFISRGVPAEKIIETGIPVSGRLYQSVSKQEAREKLDLPQDKAIVLLSCGTIGSGGLRTKAASIIKMLDPNTLMYVLTGNNRALLKSMSGKMAIDRVTALPFTSQMDLWMSAADMLLSKAGGLTSTEAVTRGRPVIFFDAVPGLESHNIEYLITRGCALSANNNEQLSNRTMKLLSSPTARRIMIDQQRRYFHENSVKRLVDCMQELTNATLE